MEQQVQRPRNINKNDPTVEMKIENKSEAKICRVGMIRLGNQGRQLSIGELIVLGSS